ncbi:uracil-DNA glycosylase [Candidatus Kaiserbacteria bacterium]|nr:uracil-DNA glycosylase [Candidatus Kaiserbacteria bacterium]
MKQIRDEVLHLTASPLYAYRTEHKYLPVIGEGSHDASIMFIGEAPGRNEAQTGRPFCGAAGKILDDLLACIDIKREDVYIGNIVKDRPPENRDPLPGEIEIYGPFLDRQIEIIEPKVIVTLGRFSMQYVMRKFDLEFELEPISKAHGKSYDAHAPYGPIHIIPQYHPAAAIYNRELLDTIKADFEVISKFV